MQKPSKLPLSTPQKPSKPQNQQQATQTPPNFDTLNPVKNCIPTTFNAPNPIENHSTTTFDVPNPVETPKPMTTNDSMWNVGA
jgi:hypothetical protein